MVVCECYVLQMCEVWSRVPSDPRFIHSNSDDVGSQGNLRSLNDLAKQARADHIIHTGDFGFYDESSLERVADK